MYNCKSLKHDGKTISGELSAKISNLGFVCSLLVVLLHVGASSQGNAIWISNYISSGICRVAVPWFFTVSGFFLARCTCRYKWYAVEVKKRLWSLLIPFFIWLFVFDVFGIGLTITANIVHGRLWSENLRYGWWALSYIGLYIYDAPYLYVLWYVRNLFLLVLISPVLFSLSMTRHGYLVGVFALIINFVFRQTVEPFVYFFSLTGLAYFCFGSYFNYNTRWKDILFGIPNWVYGVCLFVGVLVCKVSQPISFVLIIPSLLKMMPTRRWSMSRYAFPVFILHPFFLVLMDAVGLKYYNVAGMVLVKLFFVMLGCMAGAWLLHFISPVCYKVVFGGR